MDVQAQAGPVNGLVVMTGGGVTVAVAGQTFARVPRRSRGPGPLVEQGATGATVGTARVVGALTFRMLKLTKKTITFYIATTCYSSGLKAIWASNTKVPFNSLCMDLTKHRSLLYLLETLFCHNNLLERSDSSVTNYREI